ncbi:MAG: hypothetical protein ACI4VQ_05780, partial [Clostridia bacterium]
MKELKINPRFEKFSPKKKQDEIDKLRNSLREKGYIGSPILTWHGFIVDGHNRYKMCKELGITIDLDKNVEEINLGDNAEEIDAMDWMLTHQLSSKNLSVGEKLAMTEEFKKEVALENERKKSEAGKNYGKGMNNSSTPIGVNLSDNKNDRKDTWTDNQIAKKAGVGTGSVARYNKIMKSDDDELKEQVKTGQVTVNKAYEEVRKREVRTCKICGKEKKIIDFFGNDTICKECSRKKSEENINLPKMQSSIKETENMKDVYEDVLTAKSAKYQINQDYELSWLNEICHDFISQINDRLFNLLGVINKMDGEHIDEAYSIFESFVSDVFDIQEKIN